MCLCVQTAGARTRQLRIITALSLLLAGVFAPRSGAALAGERVTARQLVRTVDSALAGVAQAAVDPKGGLDRGQPGFAPFWNALGGLRLRVSQIEASLERRDGDFFVLLDQGSADLGSLRVAWARVGATNGTITEGVRVASASYRTLRANYGREGLRHRQGGELGEAERRQLQRIQRLQRRFAESLQSLRERSRRRGDAATVAELDRFRAEAERIASAPLVLESYLNALIAGGEMRGEWEATVPYVRSGAAEDFAAADAMVQDLFVESDIGQVFTVDLGTDGGWSYLDQEMEVPAGEVQSYQLAGGETAAPAAEEIAAPVIMAEEDAEGDDSGPEVAADLAEGDAGSEDGIVEEEDLGEVEAAKPETDPASAKASPPAKAPQKDSKPAKPEPASPPDTPPLSPPIG